METWKKINGYDGYMVSTLGIVKSLNYNHTNQERILKPRKTTNGYLQVDLYKDGKHNWRLIHRLVAEAFVPNDDIFKVEVNHKDENKENNIVDNLEWCDSQYNHDYSLSIAVVQFTLDGKKVNEFKSAIEAARQLGFHQGSISSCCNGKRKTAHNYKWQYKYEN